MQPASLRTGQADERADDRLLDELRQQVGQRNFDHWFHQKATLTVNSDELTIGVGSPFLLNWMQKQFRKSATLAAQTVLGISARVRFEVDSRVSLTQTSAKSGRRSVDEAVDPAGTAIEGNGCNGAGAQSIKPSGRTQSPASNGRSNGRRFADLADFVEGPCNELAVTAARQLSELPGSRFNPLYIHGPVGTGKTHLLEGIYRRVRRQFPALQVTFLTSEAFANYFTQALREHTLPSFRQRFRNVDVLIVDDIDFLDAKRVIQEEFLHTFKQLVSHSRQVVLAADRHPRLLTKLSDELTTRFLSGLVCRLEPPDLETRQRIVERKAIRMKGAVTSEALRFVAQRFKNNVRELEGALNCLQTYHTMTKKRIGVTAARQVLADLERDCIRVVRMSDIENAVCQLFGLAAKDLKSSRRIRSVSHPRMLAMFLARKHTQAAYSEIGQYFGGRNHSTVMSAEQKVTTWLSSESSIKVAAENWPLHEVLETLEQQLLAS